MSSFTGLLIVVAVAFAAPFVLGLFPRVRVPFPATALGLLRPTAGSQPFANSSAARGSNSNATNRSSPTTHAS